MYEPVVRSSRHIIYILTYVYYVTDNFPYLDGLLVQMIKIILPNLLLTISYQAYPRKRLKDEVLNLMVIMTGLLILILILCCSTEEIFKKLNIALRIIAFCNRCF